MKIIDALIKQAKTGCVLAYKFKGQRFNCGSVEGHIEATHFCYENLYQQPPKATRQKAEQKVPEEGVA